MAMIIATIPISMTTEAVTVLATIATDIEGEMVDVSGSNSVGVESRVIEVDMRRIEVSEGENSVGISVDNRGLAVDERWSVVVVDEGGAFDVERNAPDIKGINVDDTELWKKSVGTEGSVSVFGVIALVIGYCWKEYLG